MIAILIFAGRSKRFWPLTEKSFFPLAGTTLVEEQARRLKEAGIDDILCVAGKHNRARAKATFPTLKIVEQKNLDLGMQGALLCALPRCKEEPILVVGANDIIDTDAYRTLIARGKSLKEGGLLLAQKVRTYFPGGYLSLKGKRISSIIEKPTPGSEPSALVNIVAHVHASPRSLLQALKEVGSTNDDGYELALDALFQREKYSAVLYTGTWQAIKYPWHLLSVLPLFLPKNGKPKIHASASVHRTAVIEGAVILEEGVKVFPHASVIGPCTIGKGTIIANNALVRGSSVGANCVIGYNTEIARSVLAENVWTHMSYVGDSVLGEDVSLGGGTLTGNLRLDEKEITSTVRGKSTPTELMKFGAIIGSGCRTGIQTALSPGVKIGAGSFISSATHVTEDVPEHSFVKMDGGKMLIRPNREQGASSSGRISARKLLHSPTKEGK
jgi:bifunctional UDP-N-acetylglucosamine pyrophosphorylase/glucosamine-1-phosphate N-acetyltransferase